MAGCPCLLWALWGARGSGSGRGVGRTRALCLERLVLKCWLPPHKDGWLGTYPEPDAGPGLGPWDIEILVLAPGFPVGALCLQEACPARSGDQLRNGWGSKQGDREGLHARTSQRSDPFFSGELNIQLSVNLGFFSGRSSWGREMGGGMRSSGVWGDGMQLGRWPGALRSMSHWREGLVPCGPVLGVVLGDRNICIPSQSSRGRPQDWPGTPRG